MKSEIFLVYKLVESSIIKDYHGHANNKSTKKRKEMLMFL